MKDIKKYIEKNNLYGYTIAVYDENTYKATIDRHPEVNLEIILPNDNLHANEHGVDLLLKQLPDNAKILIAIGSGTIHDIVRYTAYQKELDFISCPTAASVDGFCSSVAAMTWHGCKKTLTAVAPKIVVADIDIIKNAPIYLTKSGFGDMIGKYIALTDWKIAHILIDEYYCQRISDMTLEATKLVENSVEEIFNGNEKAYENLMYGLLLSGLSMQMIGNSRPASGAEHHISHLIEMQPDGLDISSKALHGEKVGVGTLIATKEYKKLLYIKGIKFKNYSEFNKETITKFFSDDKSDEIIKENTNDSANDVTADILSVNWDKICNELNKLPDIEKLTDLYNKFNIKSRLSDIDVPDSTEEDLLKYSPMVRNRLTLMRLRKCIIPE